MALDSLVRLQTLLVSDFSRAGDREFLQLISQLEHRVQQSTGGTPAPDSHGGSAHAAKAEEEAKAKEAEQAKAKEEAAEKEKARTCAAVEAATTLAMLSTQAAATVTGMAPATTQLSGKGTMFVLNSNGRRDTFSDEEFAPADQHFMMSTLLHAAGSAGSAGFERDGGREVTKQEQKVQVSADASVLIDLSQNPDDPPQDRSAVHHRTAETSKPRSLAEFFPLALDPSVKGKCSSKLYEFIYRDMDALWPGLQTLYPQSVCDTPLSEFCRFLHASMMEAWGPTTTRFTREQLGNLKAGKLVHEEIADQLIHLICEIMGAAYLDSSGQMHPAKGAEGRLLRNLEIINTTIAAETLVLPCTYSALVADGNHRFANAWNRNGTLKPFSTILWLKAGDQHFTTVRMDLKRDGTQEVTAVEVLLADSNARCKNAPALDRAYIGKLQTVSAQLFPGATFREGTGVDVPRQATMDCLFHTAFYQVNTISGHTMDSPPTRFWPVQAGRLRSYFLCIVYQEMRGNGAELPKLTDAYAAWTLQRYEVTAAPPKRALEQGRATEQASNRKRARAGADAAAEVDDNATIRSADMGSCCLAIASCAHALLGGLLRSLETGRVSVIVLSHSLLPRHDSALFFECMRTAEREDRVAHGYCARRLCAGLH